MISFKRTKRRNYTHPGGKYMTVGIAGAFVLLAILMFSAFSAKSSLQAQMRETREMMAASIQRDMNEVLGSYKTIDRKSADLTGDILPTMRQHLYAAYEMNRVLTQTFGDQYSMIDDEHYKTFQSIMDQYDQLLAAGQSTDPARENLTTCMTNLEQVLANRFTADGGLLPRTVFTSKQP